jgi:hypothetical protein
MPSASRAADLKRCLEGIREKLEGVRPGVIVANTNCLDIHSV